MHKIDRLIEDPNWGTLDPHQDIQEERKSGESFKPDTILKRVLFFMNTLETNDKTMTK
jgi:hypothetical protein